MLETYKLDIQAMSHYLKENDASFRNPTRHYALEYTKDIFRHDRTQNTTFYTCLYFLCFLKISLVHLLSVLVLQ